MIRTHTIPIRRNRMFEIIIRETKQVKGYNPEKTVLDVQEVYSQRVEELDLWLVIEAVNVGTRTAFLS